MRAAALLLVSAVVRVGAFSSLPASEQIESRVGKSGYTVVKTGAYCENRDGGVRLGGSFASVQACADAARANAGCGSGFSFGGGNCDCSPVGETCTISADFAGFTVFLLAEPESPPAAPPPPRSPPAAPPPPAYMVVTTGAYCGNRVCSGKSCAQSRTTKDASACAAAVMKDPKCGNSFSFGENSDPKQRYCDCAPVGAPCVATPFAFYDVYELIFDKTEKPAVCSQPSPPPPHPPPSPPPPHSPPSPSPPPPRPPPSPPPPRSPKVVVVESEVMGDGARPWACGAGTSLDPVTTTCMPDATTCSILTLQNVSCGPYTLLDLLRSDPDHGDPLIPGTERCAAWIGDWAQCASWIKDYAQLDQCL